MRRTVVLDVVGLSSDLLGPDTPHLSAFAARGGQRRLETILPAVTCSVQASFMTGTMPTQHGAVANGWYYRDVSEVALWKQSDALVSGEKIWEAGKKRDSAFRCAKLFWWFNMYGRTDLSVTPRPIYLADGMKLPDIYSEPPAVRDDLVAKLGPFPLFNFWGPTADLRSSRWIADAAKHVFDTTRPELSLVYLPHLDYDLQRYGSDDPRSRRAVRDVDALCGELFEHFGRQDARIIVLSEYAITKVTGAVHVNRVLREAGLLRVREELGLEKLDAGASEAFAVADHQVAHVYVRDPSKVPAVKALLERVDGVDIVLDDEGKRAAHLDHPRSGELVLVAREDRWFSYYYWLDDARAPEYARTVDIHRKPGYDPVELFADPAQRLMPAKIGWTLLKKKLGFRYLMDVVPLDTSLVKGSHGRLPGPNGPFPVFMSNEPALLPEGAVRADQVKDIVLDHVFEERAKAAVRSRAPSAEVSA